MGTLRHKIGLATAELSRTRPSTAAPAPGAPAVAPAKADVAMSFGAIDMGADPLTVQVVIPPYDESKASDLVSLTAIAVPLGSGKPSTGQGYLESSHPKASLSKAPAPVAVAALAAVATPETVAIPTPAPSPSPAPAPVAQPDPVNVVAHPAPVAPTPAPTDTPALPGGAGGTVTLAIPNVPNGKFMIQLIESYAD